MRVSKTTRACGYICPHRSIVKQSGPRALWRALIALPIISQWRRRDSRGIEEGGRSWVAAHTSHNLPEEDFNCAVALGPIRQVGRPVRRVRACFNHQFRIPAECPPNGTRLGATVEEPHGCHL